MKHDSVHERLREILWRRPLTAAEAAELRAWLAAHPDAAADWATEQQLSRAVRRLADAPVPSNFTARVSKPSSARPPPRPGPRPLAAVGGVRSAGCRSWPPPAPWWA